MSDSIKNAWNEWSDGWFQKQMTDKHIGHIRENPMWAFPKPIQDLLESSFPNLNGKRVLVPSSGDNGAVFAFHLLGANVTSADISEKQLANAKQYADKYGWNIKFVCADSMVLYGIKEGEYDLVYTSNRAHVWIDDLSAMYSSFHRVLKPNGRYIMFETHPIIRPFDDADDDSPSKIKIVRQYGDIYLPACDNHPETYLWRIKDFVNALLKQGMQIENMEEFQSSAGDCHSMWWYDSLEDAQTDGLKKFDWKHNPWAALPQWIGFSTIKSSPGDKKRV